MEKFKYVTIKRNEDLKMALTKLAAYLGPLDSYEALDRPETLMASAKILKLRKRTSINQIAAKIDGPGFIIDKLFEYFNNI